MKKEYMRPELTVLSLVVEDNTNLIEVKGTAGVDGSISLGGDDSLLSVTLGEDGGLIFTESMFG